MFPCPVVTKMLPRYHVAELHLRFNLLPAREPIKLIVLKYLALLMVLKW